MAEILSINQIISVMKDISLRHFQINSFMSSPTWDIASTKYLTHPLLHVQPVSGLYIRSESAGSYPIKELTFELRVIDLVNMGLENEDDVSSDTEQIIADIITEINEHPYYQRSGLQLVGDINTVPLTKYSDDECNGTMATLTLRMKNHTAFCGLPFTSISGFAFPGPDPTEYQYNTQFLTCETVTGCTTLQGYISQLFASASTPNYYTTAATLVDNIVYFDRNDLLSAYTLDLSSFTSATQYEYWTSGSTWDGTNFPIKANNNSGLDATGFYAVAEGENTFASGRASSAGGKNNSVTGDFSNVKGLNNINTGYASSIVGGSSNIITSDPYTSPYSNSNFIGGGLYNKITGNYSAIVGGRSNSASSISYSTIIGGRGNVASGNKSFIGNGNQNSATTNPYSTIINGYKNYAYGKYSFIGNGSYNFANDKHVVIGAGYKNSATTNYASIVNGNQNLASGNKSFIGNGYQNLVSGNYSIISNGYKNLASGYRSAIVNGIYNSATTNYSTIVNGNHNLASGNLSFICNGWYNSATSYTSTVINGKTNLSIGNYAVIVGGKQNLASGNKSFIGNGRNNSATTNTYSTVINGINNLSTGYNSFIGNGYKNSNSGNRSFIGNGFFGLTTAGRSFIGNGNQNSATTNNYSTIVNGRQNLSSGYNSFIGNGYKNLASSTRSFIGNGSNNSATTNTYSTVINGKSNRSSGVYSSILNGINNISSGRASSILAGTGHTVSGINSAVIGGGSINGSANDTVYVPYLNVQSASTDNSLTNIFVRDSNGDVKIRNISTLTSATQYEYWTSGSTGTHSIKANNDSGLDATGDYAVAEGYNTLASGEQSHAEGLNSQATGNTSHSEGRLTIAGGAYSHAEGRESIALGTTSHAEGYQTAANGNLSHAEGWLTISTGIGSHAEGSNTESVGNYSHAEGYGTITSGVTSHAEGSSTTAVGNYSHAGGINSIASGQTSFVHGSGSTAGGNNTIVLGANITGNTDDTTYVDYFNIKRLNNTPSTATLGIDIDGYITTASTSVSGLYVQLSGDTMTGGLFTPSLTANTISATTYLNLPTYGIATYMFIGVASDVSPYQQMVSLPLYTTAATASSSTTVTTTPTLLGGFITNLNFPNINIIPAGTFNIHFETQKAAGSNNYYSYAEIYKRSSGGTETLLLTSDNTSQVSVNTILQNTVAATSPSNIVLSPTDRILIKIYSVMLSSSASITLRWDDNTQARLEFPSTLVDISNLVPYTGAITNVNLGSNSLTASNISGSTVAGDILLSGSTNLYDIFSVSKTGSFGYNVDALTNAITGANYSEVQVPYNCTITDYYLSSTDSSSGTGYTGNTIIDINRLGTSIIGSGNKPTLAGTSSQESTVTGWTSTNIIAGDKLMFYISSSSITKKIFLSINVTKN